MGGRSTAALAVLAVVAATTLGTGGCGGKSESPSRATTIIELGWHSPIAADGQVVMPNHDRLLSAPVVSDNGKRVLYRADFAGYSDESLFLPEASPGEGFLADAEGEKLVAFPPGDCPLLASEDLQTVILARFSGSGQSIYSLDPESGKLVDLVKDSAIGCDYDVSGYKLAYLTGTRPWEIRDGTIWMDALGLEVPSPKPTANEIYVLDLTSGEQAKVPAAPGLYWVPRVSRDGTRVAFLSYEGMSSGPAAYLADLANGTVEKISESDQADSISISADGTRIAYFAETDEEWIKSIRVYDTTMGDFVFTSEDSRFRELQIFPAGDKLAVTEEEPITHARRPGDPEPEDRLRIIDIESGERVTIPGDIPSFTISPNGRYMGYAARNGQFDKGVPTGVTDTGLEYGETKLDVAYRGYIREVE